MAAQCSTEEENEVKDRMSKILFLFASLAGRPTLT